MALTAKKTNCTSSAKRERAMERRTPGTNKPGQRRLGARELGSYGIALLLTNGENKHPAQGHECDVRVHQTSMLWVGKIIRCVAFGGHRGGRRLRHAHVHVHVIVLIVTVGCREG